MPQKRDKWGLLVGSRGSQLAGLFEKGYTMSGAVAKVGGKTRYNLLRRLESWGHRVYKDGQIIYLVHRDQVGQQENRAPQLGLANDIDRRYGGDELQESRQLTFGLERDLQRALRANLEQLEEGLQEADGGTERSVETGSIDITAKDPSGTLVVIELKAGTAEPEAVSQILAYMGALQAETEAPVRGILVAEDFSLKALRAAFVVPALVLQRYSYSFKFKPVEE